MGKHKVNRQIKPKSSRLDKRQWLFGLVVTLLAAFFIPDLFSFDYEQERLTDDEALFITEQFNGFNFNVFPQQKKIPVELVSVNDGDTIRIDINDYEIPVRYLMIDTPEMNYQNRQPEPFAVEATERNKDYLQAGDQVYIEFDVGPYTDNYNRILAYVYSDDIMLNEALVEEGLAFVRYINPPNNSYENLLRQAEEKARQNQINLWE